MSKTSYCGTIRRVADTRVFIVVVASYSIADDKLAKTDATMRLKIWKLNDANETFSI